MRAKTSREPLSRERALAAAVALVDAEGLPALTMRRLAADLGVEAMSLYYHLPGKEGLLNGLAETVITEITAAARHAADLTAAPRGGAEPSATAARGSGEPSAPTGRGAEPSTTGESDDWRASLRGRFLAAREVMLRHPWAPGLLSSRPAIPPALFAYYDEIVATLIGGGCSPRLAHRALHSFGSLALGFAQEIFTPGTTDVDAAEEELAAMAEALPNLTAMMAAEVHDATDPSLGWCDSQTEFEFTVDLLLDGIARARADRP